MGIDWEFLLDEEDGAKLQDAYDAAIDDCCDDYDEDDD